MVVKTQRNGSHYAIKTFIEKGEPTAQGILPYKLEAEILRRIDHPNIPHLVEAFSLDGVYYIVQEFIDGRPLSYLLESGIKLNEGEVKGIISQVLFILNDIHCPKKRENAVVHRDLRLSNLLLHENKVYLIDFGFARFIDQTQFPLHPDPLEIKFRDLPFDKPREFLINETKSQKVPGPETYMLLRKEISPRSDLFGVGVVAVDLFSSWVKDEALFSLPWEDVLPLSDHFVVFLKKLLSREGGFETALEALNYLRLK